MPDARQPKARKPDLAAKPDKRGGRGNAPSIMARKVAAAEKAERQVAKRGAVVMDDRPRSGLNAAYDPAKRAAAPPPKAQPASGPVERVDEDGVIGAAIDPRPQSASEAAMLEGLLFSSQKARQAQGLGSGQPSIDEQAEHEDDPENPPGWKPNVKQHPFDRYTPAQIIMALEASAGIKLGAAQKLRCSRTTLDRYIKNYPPIAAALERIEHERLDLAESVLVKRLTDERSGHLQLQATMFYLRTKGASRGYSEKQILATAPDQPLEIKSQVNWDSLPVDALRALVEHIGVSVAGSDDDE